MKPEILLGLTLLICIILVSVDCALRESTTIIPVEITDKMSVHPEYEKFGEPAPPLHYLKIEARSSEKPFIYLYPVSLEDFDRLDEGDWIPIYQEVGPMLGILYRTVVILEE